ncbi:MAG TPA: TIGR03009 domain-containing protein [Pirellulales bacterium]|nr:TIGR03009 domain-containing protein [Pirellulales bacterium]
MLSRCSRMSIVAWCLIGASLLVDAASAQVAPRRKSDTAAGANDRPVPPRQPRSASGPTRQPQRQAAVPQRSQNTKFSQFAPRPRTPQATWGILSPEHDAAVELVLNAWEKRSSEIKTLECSFTCLQYDKVFGEQPKDGRPPRPKRLCGGEIKYAAPDRGHYHITKEAKDPANNQPVFEDKEDGEHWVCDGNAVYEFNHEKQQLIERRLPNELKGKAISNSPLPFVFGTTADSMRRRYWMRLVTPKAVIGREIWLQVEPIYAEDRANYQRATVILNEKQMLPKAVSLELPNGNKTNYIFDDDPSINNPLRNILGTFKVPRTPAGWKRIVEEPPAPSDRLEQPGDVQTLRVPQGVKRK